MAGGSPTPVLRILILWPMVMAIGWFAVIWVYDRLIWFYWLDRINEYTSIALVVWLVAPALHWLLLPADGRRPGWLAFTAATAGVTIGGVFLVELGILLAREYGDRLTGMSIDDTMRLFEDVLALKVDYALWDPLGIALVPLAQVAGYAIGLGLMARRLALIYALAGIAAAVICYLVQQPLIVWVIDMMGAEEIAAFPTFKIGAILVLAGVFGGAGACAVAAWSAWMDRPEEEEVPS